MKYIAIVIRILIIVVWIKLMSLSGWKPLTPPFCSWLWFILIWLYLVLQALFGPRAMTCPFIQLKCPMNKDWVCEK